MVFLPGELNIDALNAADEALLNAFVEVANINKSIQAKLKSAPKDVLNDDVKRVELVNRLWEEETGVKTDGDAVKFAAMERDGSGKSYWQIETEKDIFNGLTTIK